MSTGLLGFESVRERQGGALEYVSPSRLSCWLSCPLKWKFRYLDGIRTPTTPALFVGKACHAGLEGFYRHRQLGVTLEADDVAERMFRSWAQLMDEEKMVFDSPEAEQAMRQQAADLVRAYLAYPSRSAMQCPTYSSREPGMGIVAPPALYSFAAGFPSPFFNGGRLGVTTSFLARPISSSETSKWHGNLRVSRRTLLPISMPFRAMVGRIRTARVPVYLDNKLIPVSPL
jgi:hypothetical protein